MNLERVFQLIRESWWLILIIFLVVVGATSVFTYRQEPEYRATTTLVAGPSEQIVEVDEIVDSLNTLERRSVMATYARISSSRQLRNKVYERLGVTGRERYSYYVRCAVLPDTNILEISVHGPTPEDAAKMANAVSEEARDYIKQFYGIYALQQLDPATPSSRQLKPDWQRNLSISIVLGLFLGFFAAVLWEYLRHRQDQLA